MDYVTPIHKFEPHPAMPLRCEKCLGWMSHPIHETWKLERLNDSTLYAPTDQLPQFTQFDLQWMKIIEKGDWMKGIFEV